MIASHRLISLTTTPALRRPTTGGAWPQQEAANPAASQNPADKRSQEATSSQRARRLTDKFPNPLLAATRWRSLAWLASLVAGHGWRLAGDWAMAGDSLAVAGSRWRSLARWLSLATTISNRRWS